MRILIVNPYAIPPSQPGGTRHHSLARALMARGHRVLLAASAFDHLTRTGRLDPGEAVRAEILEGVPFLWLGTPPYRGNGIRRLWNMLAFERGIRRLDPALLGGRPDVVVGSSPHLPGARGALALARALGVPFVLELRDVWPQSLVEVMDVPRWHPVVRWMEGLERDLYRGADHIVTLLSEVAGRVEARGGNPRALTWVPNGIDLALFPRVEPPPEREPFTFMYAGAHGVTNALDVVLEAAALLQARERAGALRPCRVVLMGTGPEKARLEARVRGEGLGNLSFLPPVPKREVPGALARADAFLVSSRDSRLWEHGVSFNKIYDFMAMARPVVAGLRCPRNPILQADAGLVVPPGDPVALAGAMVHLAGADPGVRRAMGLRGRHHVETHSDVRILAGHFEGALETARAGWRSHAG